MRYLSYSLEEPTERKKNKMKKTVEQKKTDVAAKVNETGLATEKAATAALELCHSKAIRGACQLIIDKTVETGRLYLDLCLYIRKNQVAPKLVSFEMTEMGFNRQVVSRVNKVAGASNELFSQFEARTIGFNKVLELSRAPAAIEGIAADSGEDVIDVKAQVEELEAGDGGSGPVVEPTSEEKEEKLLKAYGVAASKVLSVAAALQWRKEKKVIGGNGYELVVRKQKGWKPAAEIPAEQKP